MSFRANGVMFYEVNINHRKRLLSSSLFQSNAAKLETRDRYKGLVTAGAKKRMQKCITLLIQSTPYTYKTNPTTGRTIAHKLSFVTLTTPQHEKSLDAKYCHKNLLEPLLRTLRRKHNLKSYIWKCELQSNGQIHYHLTCDIVMHYKTLRAEWNKLLDRNKMLDGFELKYGHKDPNSTDIHNVRNINNLEAYLVKYICKEYQNEERLNAKIWDASLNLKRADYYKFHLDIYTHKAIRQLQETKQVITHYYEKAIFLDFKTNDYYTFFSSDIVNSYFKHLKDIYEWTFQKLSPKPTPSTNSPPVISLFLKKELVWTQQQLTLI